ncbi:DUF4143 domain-containing protein [Actinotignum sanguinis]|uniref:DUF4143 domain-containing protein n=1 Tax=Actinotignum TaxID=1653174 RepID=UPI00254CB648|nr:MULTISPECIES: DUF4143 domain-containing protein [Actinotignum]MDK7198378.1 DUF4143 domain-containing protein [Actinotignum sanguinis]MDY5158017.1 DUF4143 domain-containing protein [Actinotignum timonense]
MIEALLRPGFPGMLELAGEAASFALTSYLQEVTRADIPRIITLRQDPQLILHLLRAPAHSVATEVSIATLKKDLDAVFPASSRQTVSTLLDTLGFIFESAVAYDLSVFAETLGGHVRHYRDSYGHEIDAVLEFPGGVWAGVEVKLGGGQITQCAHSLKKRSPKLPLNAANPLSLPSLPARE